MVREAELFVMAEQVAVEVLGRIRPEHWRTAMPPLTDEPGDGRTTMRQAVLRYAQEDAAVPAVVAGGAEPSVELGGDDVHPEVVRLSDAACAAARGVGADDAAARDHLLHLAVRHSFVAHDVAMHLGSRACPLTEELARGLWERTEPEAAAWRARGVFRDRLPLPPDVSWRDRFLLTAGRDPHPLH